MGLAAAAAAPGNEAGLKAETSSRHSSNLRLTDSAAPPAAAPLASLVPTSSRKAGEFDALLDQLMNLHRNDVAAREANIVAPQDFPVLVSDKALVVTMADGGYGACAVRLLRSVRDAGRWGSSIVVLVPTGDGTLPLHEEDVVALRDLRAALVEVGPELAGGVHVRGAGSAAQYAKVVLLVEDRYRRYDSILFLDADGVVGAPLQPLLQLSLPSGRAVAMPTWPSAAVKHESFYTREVDIRPLSSEAVAALKTASPDRTLVGITAWFLLQPRRLPSPQEMRRQVTWALEQWRAAFRFNDQGLWNVLFYNNSAFYPLCLSGPKATANGERDFHPLVMDSLAGLAGAIESACGSSIERRKPMYVHPMKDCIPPEEWERKQKSNAALPAWRLGDLKRRG